MLEHCELWLRLYPIQILVLYMWILKTKNQLCRRKKDVRQFYQSFGTESKRCMPHALGMWRQGVTGMKSRCNRNVHMLRPAAESKKLHNMSCFRVLFSSGTESMRVGGNANRLVQGRRNVWISLFFSNISPLVECLLPRYATSLVRNIWAD